MVCSAHFGELTMERKMNWDNGEQNPYGVLQTSINLYGKGHILLEKGAQYFHDQIAIDWGCIAWKCLPEEIYRFLNDTKKTLPWLVDSDTEMIEKVKLYIKEREHAEFGIVFIEEC